jgi:hypothetical protein
MNNNFEMNPQQVQDRLHSCGLSAEEVTRVNLCIAEGKINPSGWVFLTDENLGSSLRTSISQQAVPATGFVSNEQVLTALTALNDSIQHMSSSLPQLTQIVVAETTNVLQEFLESM